MKRKYRFLAVSLVSILAFEAVAPSIITHKNYGAEYLSSITSNVKADDVLDVEIPESLQEIFNDPNQEIDIQDMDTQELQSFEQIIQNESEKADLPTPEDTEAYKQALTDYFDSSSDVYQDAVGATEQVIDDVNENHKSPLDKITGEKVLAASHGSLSVKLLGGIINIFISAATGYGASTAARVLIRKFGAAQAKRILSRTLRNALVNAGMLKAAGSTETIVGYIYLAVDPGTAAAKWLDSRDKIRNNGWLEWW